MNTVQSASHRRSSPSIEDSMQHAFRHTSGNFGALFLGTFAYSFFQVMAILLFIASIWTTLGGLFSMMDESISTDASIALGSMSIPLVALAFIFMFVSWILRYASMRGFAVTDNIVNVNVREFFVVNGNVGKAIVTDIVVGFMLGIPMGIFFALSLIVGGVGIAGDEPAEAGAQIASLMLMALGFISLLVLMFYARFATFYSLHQGQWAFSAIANSFKDVSKQPLYALAMGVIMEAVLFASSILLLPLIFFLPMYQVATAHTYHRLSEHRVNSAIRQVNQSYYAPQRNQQYSPADEDFQAVIDARRNGQ